MGYRRRFRRRTVRESDSDDESDKDSIKDVGKPKAETGAKRCYDPSTSNKVFWCYIIAILLWILLIYLLRLYIKADFIVWLVLLIPVVLFAIGAYNANKITIEVESSVFQNNYLSLGLLIVIPLLTWISKDFAGDKKRFISVLILAVILNVIAMIDIWVTRDNLSVVKHVKSIIQTMASVLIVYALYTYYLEKPTSAFTD